MTSKWRFITAYALCNVLLACGKSEISPHTIRVGGGNTPAPVIAVQLNDLWQQAFPSEAVEITDIRYFTAPSVVRVVGGSYAGSAPGQYLHARLVVNNEQCEYQSYGINDYNLVLQFCTGGITTNAQLPENSYIELVNYDAPGYLLETHFNLTR